MKFRFGKQIQMTVEEAEALIKELQKQIKARQITKLPSTSIINVTKVEYNESCSNREFTERPLELFIQID
jgi:hypothetical protein